jgi:hypothetical protein
MGLLGIDSFVIRVFAGGWVLWVGLLDGYLWPRGQKRRLSERIARLAVMELALLSLVYVFRQGLLALVG